MTNPIKAIYKWQVEAGLADQEYDDFLESSFQIEEALEGFENLQSLAFALNLDKKYPSDADEVNHPKYLSRVITKLAKEGDLDVDSTFRISDIDRFDKAIDAVVFAIGSMAKLGLTPQQIQKGILIVNQANMQKLNMPVDEHGKKIKPEGFVGPEEQLQKILDERNSND